MDPNDETILTVVSEDGAETKTYKLHYGNRAFRRAETALAKPFAEINLERLQELTVMVWAGLLRFQPDIAIDEVDDIIDAIGYERIGLDVAEAIARAFPAAADPAAVGTAQGNRAQRRGTGQAS